MLTHYLTLLMLTGAAAHSSPEDLDPARYIRIELYGEGRILSLTEVEVFSAKTNIALTGAATQSSLHGNSGAALAIDGNLDGTHNGGSVSHTAAEQVDAWWELDLGAPFPIDQVTIWNRMDCCGDRLANYSLVLLDADREELLRLEPNPAPPIYRDHVFKGVEPRRSNASLARSHQLQTRINAAIDSAIDYLKLAQHRDGSWRGHHDGGHAHRNGLTALSAYALVKSGVKKDDPCIIRALNWLSQVPCKTTYSAACLLMLLAAVDNDEHLEWAEEVTELLIETQGSSAKGLWAYPSGTWDFSNTQYAALGLRASTKLGIRIPARVWERLIQGTLDMQVPAEVIPAPPGSRGRSNTGYRIAAFCYRAPDNNGGTGSMTTAGIGCLAIAAQALGTRGLNNPKVKKAIENAINWLTVNFSVSTNPGSGGNRRRYYLYGLERVGGLLGIQHIGPYDWYEAGATNLTGDQKGDGSWGDSETETCYGLLFLNRATASSTGGAERKGSKITHAAENPESDVWIRGSGREDLSFWLSGFPDAVLDEFTPSEALAPENARGLRIVRVEYSINDEVVARIPGDPTKAWRGERYAHRHPFKTRGDYKVSARLFVLGPDAMPGDADGVEVLLSDSFSVPVEGLLEDWMMEYSEAGAANLLRTIEVSAKVSSERNRGNHKNKEGGIDLGKQEEALEKEAKHTIDGFEFTSWVSAADDAKPTLTLRLARPLRAKRILLSPAGSNVFEDDSFDRIIKARVIINGKEKEPYEVIFPEDTLQKGVLELPKVVKLRSIQIEVIERVPQASNHGKCGLSEVSIER